MINYDVLRRTRAVGRFLRHAAETGDDDPNDVLDALIRGATRRREATRPATAGKSLKAEADAAPFLRRFDLHVAHFQRDPNTWAGHKVAIRAVCARIAREWRGSLEREIESGGSKKRPAQGSLEAYILTANAGTVIARFVRWVGAYRGVVTKDSLQRKAREANAERYGGGYSAYAEEMRRRG